jgi:hypothetical protein
MQRIANTILRVLFGTAVYVLIIVLAAPIPSAAGLFLTFPALNGLAFLYSPPSSTQSMARSMLWMPVINAALCGAYIVVFLAFSPFVAPTLLAWTLATAVAVLWLGISTRKFVTDGISRDHQAVYGFIVLLVGCALAALVPRILGGLALSQGPGSPAHLVFSLDLLPQIFWQSRLKIALFAFCLLLFLALTTRLSPSAQGVLGGLPLVPFGGLVSVATDTGTDHLYIFERMAVSVWLGPMVGIWFICGYSRYLNARRPSRSGTFDATMRFAVLLAAWCLCVLAILGISGAIAYVEPQ